MSVVKVLWVNYPNGSNDDFIMFHLDQPNFQYARTQPFPSNSMFSPGTNGWYCTLGIKNKSPFTVEPNLPCLISAKSEPKHMERAKTIDGKNNFHSTVDFNEIPAPSGNNDAFAKKLFDYANNFDGHDCLARGDYSVGRRDGVAWANSLFKKAGVSNSIRQRGGSTFLPHNMLFDLSLFDNPLTLPSPVAPVNPNIPNPPVPPNLEAGQKLHIVKRGDWLSKIAITYYGDMNLHPKIYNWTDKSNPHWNRKEIGTNPDLIQPGMRIIIPPKSAVI